ncbi:MAG TPA: DUF2278 family protein [Candidatus Xenobia bacterium]|jgi:hypothetical protein
MAGVNGFGGPRFVSHGNSPQQPGTVTGEFDHEVVLHGGHGEPHARMDLNVQGQTYEADINVHSMENPDGSQGGSNVEYAVRDQTVTSLPQDGVTPGSNESYVKDGLTEADFQQVDDDQLHQQLMTMAQQSSRVSLSGQMYNDGPGKSGIHDLHQNSGDPTRASEPDGVSRFYIPNGAGTWDEKSVYIKFQSQTLDSTG